METVENRSEVVHCIPKGLVQSCRRDGDWLRIPLHWAVYDQEVLAEEEVLPTAMEMVQVQEEECAIGEICVLNPAAFIICQWWIADN